MKIYFWAEHTSTFPHNTGIQRVTRCLARALVERGEEVVPLKWAPETRFFQVLSASEREHLGRWNGPAPEKLSTEMGNPSGGWLLVPELVSEDHRPSLGILTEAARAQGLRVAVVFYDALPQTLEVLYSTKASWLHEKYMEFLSDVDVILPISEASGRHLLESWQERKVAPAAMKKVHPCVLAGEFLERPRTTTLAVRRQDAVTILSVGTVEPRKNHLALVRGFLRARQKARKGLSMRLVLVGRCSYPELGEELRKLIGSHPEADIVWKEKTDDRGLSDLYAACDFTVYPSLAEGFGLPVLESLWHARPVICYDQGALGEVASTGGCLTADVRSVEDLADKILRLAEDADFREQLARSAVAAPIKTWAQYADDVVSAVSRTRGWIGGAGSLPKPLLSICVTTYNRAAWLSHSLPLILEQTKPYQDLVEVVVCDNASQDNTRDVVRGFGGYANLYYHRNEKNVGMLGNLAVSAEKGRGRYIWVIGDDDLLVEGTIERLIFAIFGHPESELIYMNYAFTHFDQPEDLRDVHQVIRNARAISPHLRDASVKRVSEIAAKTENCFTAIYCLVFRSDHARKVYGQDISGAPFSSLSTCVPTADYVCRKMFDRPGFWIGDPCVVVNMNVSWMRYASVYILERFPELFDLMQEFGAAPAEMDVLRANHIPNMMTWLERIYFSAQKENLPLFRIERLVERFRHVPLFRQKWAFISGVYKRAFSEGLATDASLTPAMLDAIFAAGEPSREREGTHA